MSWSTLWVFSSAYYPIFPYPFQLSILTSIPVPISNWKWPSIEGLKSFKGTLLHSAAFDNSIDLTGKTVAVIGSGSSGIQIIPSIQKRVKHLGAYLRSSTWIVPMFGSEFIKDDENGEPIYAYSEEERNTFATDPDAFLEYRYVSFPSPLLVLLASTQSSFVLSNSSVVFWKRMYPVVSECTSKGIHLRKRCVRLWSTT